jgi:hypothetical protein
MGLADFHENIWFLVDEDSVYFVKRKSRKSALKSQRGFGNFHACIAR